MSNQEMVVGVELEFYVPSNARRDQSSTSVDAQPRGDQRKKLTEAVHSEIAKCIQSAGLPSAVLLSAGSNKNNSELLRKAGQGTVYENIVSMGRDRIRGGDTNPAYKFWLVKDEEDLWGEREDWVAAKCSSPILPLAQAAPDLRRALAVIRNATHDRLIVNERCGYHVHVSQGGNVTMEMARRVATLVFLLDESLLFRLVHPSRKENNGSLAKESYFSTMRSVPGSAESVDSSFLHLPGRVRDKFGHQLRHLWTTRDMYELQRRLQGAHMRTALALKMHEHPDGTETWTLEFRHAQGSFREKFVTRWLNLVVAICQLASLSSSAFGTQLVQLHTTLNDASLTSKDKMRRILGVIRFGTRNATTSSSGLHIEDWADILGSYQEA